MDGFKIRHYIKKYILHGKTKAINLVVVKEKLQKIWDIINLYTNGDIYNIDEFALFWKITLEKTLDTEQSVRKKYKKAWITINFVCSISESYKLKL